MVPQKRKPNRIMATDLRINLKPMLKARGIDREFAFLLKIGISSGSIKRILNGSISSLNLQHLTKICTQLRCTPNDIFSVEKPNTDASHPLNALANKLPDLDIKDWLKKASIDEIRKVKELSKKKKDEV